MQEKNFLDLKKQLKRFVKDFGAYDVRFADSNAGFKHASPGCRPEDVLKSCNSVIAFAIYVGSEYYRTLKLESKISGEDRIMHIFRDWLQYRTARYLQERGHCAVVPTGYINREKMISSFSSKLAAYEAGIGIYGRCGIIITPRYGPRVNIGVVLTDAKFKPDPKLTGFTPCIDCHLCADLCPPKAIRENTNPPSGHNREKCISFIRNLRENTHDQNFYCGYCYDSCPIGKTDKTCFTLSKYKSLLDLASEERELLITRTQM